MSGARVGEKARKVYHPANHESRPVTNEFMIASALPPPKRVLVIRLQNHGDVLLTTPIFTALKRHFPGVEVDALVFSETLPMLVANPALTRVWPLPRGKQAGRGLGRVIAFVKLMMGIRRRHYDWVLHLNDQWSGAFAAAISGASVRFGYEVEKRDYWLWRKIFPQRIVPTFAGHMVEKNLDVLKALGVPVDTRNLPCTMAFSSQDATLVRQAWTARIGSLKEMPLMVQVQGRTIAVASADGVVAVIDATTGGDIWRLSLNEALSAGVGSDGKWTAVVSGRNELVVLEAGRELWRKRLPSQVYTAPLVAGARIFVLGAGIAEDDVGFGLGVGQEGEVLLRNVDD